MKVKLKLIHENAKLLTKAYDTDAGWDIYTPELVRIGAGETVKIPTGIALEIPTGWYAQIKSRSSLAAKGLVVSGGVVDSSYRGEIHVVLINTAPPDLEIVRSEVTRIFEIAQKIEDPCVTLPPHSKIAQIVFLPVPEVEFEIVEEFSDSARGTGGFGSTGI